MFLVYIVDLQSERSIAYLIDSYPWSRLYIENENWLLYVVDRSYGRSKYCRTLYGL